MEPPPPTKWSLTKIIIVFCPFLSVLVSVLLSASIKRFSVSRMQDFFTPQMKEVKAVCCAVLKINRLFTWLPIATVPFLILLLLSLNIFSLLVCLHFLDYSLVSGFCLQRSGPSLTTPGPSEAHP